MKPIRTWVLIADGSHARVVENLGPSKGLHAVNELSFSNELPPTREILSDRPGRDFESTGEARHAYENKTDPRSDLKRSFAKQLAELLDAKLAERAFDRCVIVAPPQMMGDLRAVTSERVKKMVVGELTHDLTKTPDHQLPQHLGQVLLV